MSIELDFSGSDPTAVFGGFVEAGKCHAMIVDVINRENDIEVSYEVLAHEIEGQVGKKFRDWMRKSGKGASRARDFALATGLVKMDFFITGKESGKKKYGIDFPAAKGQTICTTLVASEYNGKTSNKIEFDFTDPRSPAADEYPKDAEFLTDGVAAGDDEDEDDGETPF